ncbi:MAG: STAS domain-containing protein [Rhodocyclaceae bacterium]|nr:STAS domain-containing protein [Rhodocyclaceae bacterium]
MEVIVTKSAAGTLLKLGGRFDFNAHREFRDGVDRVMKESGQVDVDLADVAYLDSSALGMLLMLRDKAKGGSREVRLVNARGSVRQVLDIANFSKLFSMP